MKKSIKKCISGILAAALVIGISPLLMNSAQLEVSANIVTKNAASANNVVVSPQTIGKPGVTEKQTVLTEQQSSAIFKIEANIAAGEMIVTKSPDQKIRIIQKGFIKHADNELFTEYVRNNTLYIDDPREGTIPTFGTFLNPSSTLIEKTSTNDIVGFEEYLKQHRVVIEVQLPDKRYEDIDLGNDNSGNNLGLFSKNKCVGVSDYTINGITSKDLEVDNISGNVTVQNCVLNDASLSSVSTRTIVKNSQINDLSVESVNGHADISDLDAKEADFEVVNGEVNYTGNAPTQELKAEAINGTLNLALSSYPSDDFSCSVVNGDITLTLPSNLGFSLEMDSLSKKVDSDYTLSKAGGYLVYGDGANYIEIDTVSGKVAIKKP